MSPKKTGSAQMSKKSVRKRPGVAAGVGLERRMAIGANLADVAARKYKKVAAEQVGAAPKGLILAEGDSWFDYPFNDVLSKLEDLGWEIASSAHRGDTLEGMTYDQLDRMAAQCHKLAQRKLKPRAILLSGGGNDIAGPELVPLLNHRKSRLPAISATAVKAVIDERIRAVLGDWIGAVQRLCEIYFKDTVPIFLHGYDYMVPDGRGVLGGWGPLPGPWLQPSLFRKGYDDLTQSKAIMKDLVDSFNVTMADVAARATGVTYIDLRGTLSATLANEKYKDSWGNEIHPTGDGYAAVAAKIDAVI
jgi:lysophospholipase L1-like esterase